MGLDVDYTEHAKKYLKLYRQLLSPYPYKRFSIVESPLPVGHSMPTFTLLGQDVVRLPFIPETSLGHEIAQQLFGNYVYAAEGKGNWTEGITTFFSDALYEEMKGRGGEHRKKALLDYRSYVSPTNDFPLRDFSMKTDRASMAIGYGKGMMLFHMLKKLVGDSKFQDSIRTFLSEYKFREAAWDDIRKIFEITLLDRVFALYSSREAAFERLVPTG